MNSQQNTIISPTPDRPMLVGLMIDVSASMISAIQNKNGEKKNRIESFRDSFDSLIEKGVNLSKGENGQNIPPLFKIFAYGFGFGNPLSFLLKSSNTEKVRDLLSIQGESNSTVSVSELANNWSRYRLHIEKMSSQMFGETPMLTALIKIEERIKKEKQLQTYLDPIILFILSDGEPTDGTYNEVISKINTLKEQGVFIISCYITDINITQPRRLYGSIQENWPDGAKLMFESASIIPKGTPFSYYLQEYKWECDDNSHFFAQVNQTDIMSEFLNALWSPIEQKSLMKNTKVFISYSHQDSKYLKHNSLFGYIEGLQKHGIEFWYDNRIKTGDFWDEEIKTHIAESDIAIVLVSQAFLNSKYCTEVETVEFIKERKKKGLVMFPIIVSACDWKSHNWLSSTQCQPRDDKNIESHYKDKGKLKELFLEIYKELQNLSQI